VLGDGGLESVEALTLPCQPKRGAGRVVDDGAQIGGFGADVVDVGIGAGANSHNAVAALNTHVMPRPG
jgi:hypothetical protein